MTAEIMRIDLTSYFPGPALNVMHFYLAKSYSSQQMFSMKALHVSFLVYIFFLLNG